MGVEVEAMGVRRERGLHARRDVPAARKWKSIKKGKGRKTQMKVIRVVAPAADVQLASRSLLKPVMEDAAGKGFERGDDVGGTAEELHVLANGRRPLESSLARFGSAHGQPPIVPGTFCPALRRIEVRTGQDFGTRAPGI